MSNSREYFVYELAGKHSVEKFMSDKHAIRPTSEFHIVNNDNAEDVENRKEKISLDEIRDSKPSLLKSITSMFSKTSSGEEELRSNLKELNGIVKVQEMLNVKKEEDTNKNPL